MTENADMNARILACMKNFLQTLNKILQDAAITTMTTNDGYNFLKIIQMILMHDSPEDQSEIYYACTDSSAINCKLKLNFNLAINQTNRTMFIPQFLYRFYFKILKQTITTPKQRLIIVLFFSQRTDPST